jgi:hypothetical protein
LTPLIHLELLRHSTAFTDVWVAGWKQRQAKDSHYRRKIITGTTNWRALFVGS